MQMPFDIIYRHEGVLWFLAASVAAIGWWRFRSVSWAIFAIVLFLKSITWTMQAWPVQFQMEDDMVSAHGIFAEGLNRDPARNAWKVEFLGIIDGLVPILLISALVAQWLENKRGPNKPFDATR
jgi:hypothetical protein